MADTKDTGEKTLRVTPSKTLSLKREQGVVRQSFSHGRSKAVVVEKVKRRVVGPAGEAKADPTPPAAQRSPPRSKLRRPSAQQSPPAAQRRPPRPRMRPG